MYSLPNTHYFKIISKRKPLKTDVQKKGQKYNQLMGSEMNRGDKSMNSNG
jgi:hypothetical protein